MVESKSKSQIIRDKLIGHSKSINSIQLISDNQLLSASDDSTTRLWDIRTNKGVMLLKSKSPMEVAVAKSLNNVVVVA
jgi:WD40 repeat protein